MRWRNVAVGAGLMGLWLVASPVRAGGPVPSEFDPPGDSRFLAGLDLQRFVASPLFERFKREGASGPLQELERLRDETGLDVERDVDQVILAGSPPQGDGEHLLVYASGRFDRYALGRAIEKKRSATWKTVAGSTLYMFREGTRSAGALAFLGEHALVLGARADVEALLEGRSSGRSPLLDMAADVPGSAAFWLVTDGKLASSLSPASSGSQPGQPAGPGGFSLPPLRSTLLSGELDPELRLEVRAETLDEPAARNLAEAVRGLVLLLSMQASQKPELQKLASGIQVSSQGTHAMLSLSLPWEVVDQLAGKPAATRPPAVSEPGPAKTPSP